MKKTSTVRVIGNLKTRSLNGRLRRQELEITSEWATHQDLAKQVKSATSHHNIAFNRDTHIQRWDQTILCRRFA
jgi:hypothetical protein